MKGCAKNILDSCSKNVLFMQSCIKGNTIILDVTFLTSLKNDQLSHIGNKKSLRDILISAPLTGRTPETHTTVMGSCGPCNKPKCSWCVLMIINKTSTFIGMQ